MKLPVSLENVISHHPPRFEMTVSFSDYPPAFAGRKSGAKFVRSVKQRVAKFLRDVSCVVISVNIID